MLFHRHTAVGSDLRMHIYTDTHYIETPLVPLKYSRKTLRNRTQMVYRTDKYRQHTNKSVKMSLAVKTISKKLSVKNCFIKELNICA